VDAAEGRALKGHFGRKSAQRGLAHRNELERRLSGKRVDIADAVARLHELKAHATAPCRRQRLDNTRRPAHFFLCVTTVGQLTVRLRKF